LNPSSPETETVFAEVLGKLGELGLGGGHPVKKTNGLGREKY